MQVIEWVKARKQQIAASILAVGAMVLSQSPSWATDPVAIDFAALTTSGKDGVITAVNAFMPGVILLFAAMVALGLTIRFFKRAAKSS